MVNSTEYSRVNINVIMRAEKKAQAEEAFTNKIETEFFQIINNLLNSYEKLGQNLTALQARSIVEHDTITHYLLAQKKRNLANELIDKFLANGGTLKELADANIAWANFINHDFFFSPMSNISL